jgi:membrane protease YdiL (CAAX protease family)
MNAFNELVTSPGFERAISAAVGESAVISQLLSVALATLLFFFIRGKRLVTTDITTRRETPEAWMILALFGLALGIQFFMTVVNAALAPVLEQANMSLTEAMEEGVSAFMVNPIGLLYVILLGPFCEELVFRGALLRALEPYGANFAMMASAILFGLYHIILYQAVFAFLLGLILAYAAGRFSLKWSLLLHIANNALAMSSLIFTPMLGEQTFSLILTVLFLAGFIFSVIFLLFKRRFFVAQKVAGAPVVAQPFVSLLTRPMFIITAVLLLMLGFVYLFAL